MTKVTMYQLAVEYRELAERLKDAEQDPQAVLDTLEGERWPLEKKVFGAGVAVRELEATAEAIRKAEIEMAARRRSLEGQAERIRQNLLAVMTIAGIRTIEHPEFRVRIKAGLDKVEVFEEAMIPAEYLRHKPPEVDKVAVKEAIKAGIDIPGARLVKDPTVEIK